jgi:hypothetical protein
LPAEPRPGTALFLGDPEGETDLSQMALSWTPAPTPTVDSNPQTCHGKGFALKKRYHHPFRRCLDSLNTMLLHSSSPDIDPHSAP